MEYFQDASRAKKWVWTIGLLLILDSVSDSVRSSFNLFPDDMVLSATLGVFTALFSGYVTGLFKE